MISDKDFFKFRWPPKMLSYPFKKRKKYAHNVVITSQKDSSLAFVLTFTSEQKARAFKKAGNEALNLVSIEYERNEVPVINEDGYVS